MSLKEKSSLKISRSGWVALLIICLLLGLYGVGLLTLRNPSFKNTFWQTMEANLQSRSLSLNSQINWQSETDKSIIQSIKADFSFSPQASLDFEQSSLIRTSDSCLPTQGQLRKNALDLEERRYIQSLRILEGETYFSHDCDFQFINDLSEYKPKPNSQKLKYGQWHKSDITLRKNAELQVYFLTWLAYNGFFYGYLNPAQRKDILNHLEEFYLVDWQNDTLAYHQNGRLYYEYKLKIDRSKLGSAFLKYHNLHIVNFYEADSFSEEDIDKYFKTAFPNHSTEYTLVIDAYAQEIKSIKGSVIRPFRPMPQLDSEFILWPQFSNLIYALSRINPQHLNMEINFLIQNHRPVFQIPENKLIKEGAD